MPYTADKQRYDNMIYNRCGNSGLMLPAISLGLWHNFGHIDSIDNAKAMLFRAFDLGVTHFDLANNYGPPSGSAEENLGKILKSDLTPYRDELIISTKAGHNMWPGPYGEWGSRKYLTASLDQSLKRMGLEYVDIFYSHRPDPNTPLEETMSALDNAVRQGKALYVGISQYDAQMTSKAAKILSDLGTPCLIHQPSYSMLDRWIEDSLQDVLQQQEIGSIAFCPLAQGMLTSKYLNGIPSDSRAAKESGFLTTDRITDQVITKVRKLTDIAANRNQTLAQLAIAWVLRGNKITSALIGASKIKQVEENVAALNNLEITKEELSAIEDILA